MRTSVRLSFVNEVDRYITATKLIDSVSSLLPILIREWGIETYLFPAHRLWHALVRAADAP
jgi:hypothetical protein